MLWRERARNRQHRRRALEQPGERNLTRRCAVCLGDRPQRRSAVAAQWKVRHEQDLLLGAVVDDLLMLALREVVTVLHGSDRHDLARSLDLLDADLGDADVPDLALLAILADCREACLERRLRIDAMEVVELDLI